MAASRTTEPARGAEEKPGREAPAASEPAEGDAPEEPAAAPGASWKSWLPLGIALVVMPLCAYAVTNFVLIPRMQKTLRATGVPPGESAEAEAPPAKPAEGGGEGKAAPAASGSKQSATINKLLVNVAGTMGSRYLLSSLVLSGNGSSFADKVTQNEPQLRDMASGLLCTKSIAELEKPGARNMIRGELIAGFNTILGNNAVQEIYFTEFAIQ
jgi:flagellar FliL protein